MRYVIKTTSASPIVISLKTEVVARSNVDPAMASDSIGRIKCILSVFECWLPRKRTSTGQATQSSLWLIIIHRHLLCRKLNLVISVKKMSTDKNQLAMIIILYMEALLLHDCSVSEGLICFCAGLVLAFGSLTSHAPS